MKDHFYMWMEGFFISLCISLICIAVLLYAIFAENLLTLSPIAVVFSMIGLLLPVALTVVILFIWGAKITVSASGIRKSICGIKMKALLWEDIKYFLIDIEDPDNTMRGYMGVYFVYISKNPIPKQSFIKGRCNKNCIAFRYDVKKLQILMQYAPDRLKQEIENQKQKIPWG